MEGILVLWETVTFNEKKIYFSKNLFSEISNGNNTEIDLVYGVKIFKDEKSLDIKLSRDFFGLIPIYYFCNNDVLIFATDLRFIIESKDYIKNFNSIKIFDYLNNDEIYDNQTFWKDVFLVLPGCTVTINKSNYITNEFNFPKYQSKLDAGNNKSFVNLLLENLFIENIKNQTVATHLSGGLDSSGITSILKSNSIATCSYEVRMNKELNSEREYANNVVDYYNIENHIIFENPNGILKNAIKYTTLLGVPEFSSLSSVIQNKIIEDVKEKSIKYLYSGHDADSILGLKSDYLNELLSKKEYEKLNYAFESIQKTKREGEINIKEYFLIRELSLLFKNKKIKLFLTIVYKFNLYLPLLKFVIKKLKSSHNSSEKKIEFDLIKESEIPQNENSGTIKMSSVVNEIFAEYQPYFHSIYNNIGLKFNEFNFGVNKLNQVETIYPFYNQKIVDFILTCNKDENFYNGYGKGYFRESMKSILPEKIRLRGDKTHFEYFAIDVFCSISEFAKENFHENHEIWKFINQTNFWRLFNSLKGKKNVKNSELIYYQKLNKIIYFGIWLDIFFEK